MKREGGWCRPPLVRRADRGLDLTSVPACPQPLLGHAAAVRHVQTCGHVQTCADMWTCGTWDILADTHTPVPGGSDSDKAARLGGDKETQ